MIGLVSVFLPPAGHRPTSRHGVSALHVNTSPFELEQTTNAVDLVRGQRALRVLLDRSFSFFFPQNAEVDLEQDQTLTELLGGSD